MNTPTDLETKDRAYLLNVVAEQQSQIERVRDLANAHGRHGFLVTPADIRTALEPAA